MLADVFKARCQATKPRRFAPRWGNAISLASPSRHLCSCLAPSIGTVPPATAAGLASFAPAPLQSLQPCIPPQKPLAPCLASAHSFRRPQTVETVTKAIAPPNAKWPRDYVRPAAIARDASHGQDTAIRREAPPIAEEKAIAPRGFARCKTSVLTVSTAIFRPLHFVSPLGKMADLTEGGPNASWSDTPPLGYMAVCRDFPFAISSHSLPFRSTSGESDLLASRSATAPIANATIGYAAELA